MAKSKMLYYLALINAWNSINTYFLPSTFIDKLDLDPDLILNHLNLPSVLSYGTLVA
jgi:ABC-type uncharacterized transport system permease subunit